ncbi:Glu S.griseus protease inhibitor [Mizuhopecten yessoensis]|uniref:Glu S.griseus protease inhibitor n=1 Tax=Mizuhopecten yessoensis TaxID=6573 RepID=A0A210PKN4_MIZYE|nr:Glu S.griseus protease inhibitor [Mizuhopecten yessoensis]
MSICQGKESWPELVGVSGEEAVKVIEEENSFVTAIIVSIYQPVVGPFICSRVRVPVNLKGIVVFTPKVG